MSLPAQLGPVGLPTRVEVCDGRTVRFWFDGPQWTAVYGFTKIVLKERPLPFPEEPFVLEPYIYYPNGEIRHYGGRRFSERPTEDAFIERVCALLGSLGKTDRIDPEAHA